MSDDYASLIASFQKAVLDRNPNTALARPRAKFAADAQMQAYIDSYHLRLLHVVEKDYPTLRQYLGGEKFANLAQGYILATQSNSYNLNAYSIHFALFVKPHLVDFAQSLATLESALLEVYHAPDSIALTQQWLRTQPADYLLYTPFLPRDAFKLLALKGNANEYLNSYHEGKTAETSDSPEYLAIVRHQNQLRRFVLPAEDFELLEALISGMKLTTALEAAGNGFTDAGKLQQTLQNWIENGFFRQPE